MTAPPTLPTSGLSVLSLAMDDPRVRPLLDELAVEYDTRYGDLFSSKGASEELSRYPAEEFAAPHGALIIIQEDGESVAGGAFRRYDADTAGFEAHLDPLGAPTAWPGPPRAGRVGS